MLALRRCADLVAHDSARGGHPRPEMSFEETVGQNLPPWVCRARSGGRLVAVLLNCHCGDRERMMNLADDLDALTASLALAQARMRCDMHIDAERRIP